MKCETCGSDFYPKHTRGRFCSARCRAVAWRKGKVEAARREGRRAALAEIEAALERVREAVRGEGDP